MPYTHMHTCIHTVSASRQPACWVPAGQWSPAASQLLAVGCQALTGGLAGRRADTTRLAGRMPGWLAGWLAGWLGGWLVGGCVARTHTLTHARSSSSSGSSFSASSAACYNRRQRDQIIDPWRCQRRAALARLHSHAGARSAAVPWWPTRRIRESVCACLPDTHTEHIHQAHIWHSSGMSQASVGHLVRPASTVLRPIFRWIAFEPGQLSSQ